MHFPRQLREMCSTPWLSPAPFLVSSANAHVTAFGSPDGREELAASTVVYGRLQADGWISVE